MDGRTESALARAPQKRKLLLEARDQAAGSELEQLADTHIRIPMLGSKHSLNVATAGGVVIYELLRKYRVLKERERIAL